MQTNFIKTTNRYTTENVFLMNFFLQLLVYRKYYIFCINCYKVLVILLLYYITNLNNSIKTISIRTSLYIFHSDTTLKLVINLLLLFISYLLFQQRDSIYDANAFMRNWQAVDFLRHILSMFEFHEIPLSGVVSRGLKKQLRLH